MNYRKTLVEIDLTAIEHNVSEFVKILPQDSDIMAVVKADGYGHGAVKVLDRAIKAGASWAGVALVEEAIELRKSGFVLPILLLGTWDDESLEAIRQHSIIPIVYSIERLKSLNQFAKQNNKIQKFHLKLDTGMGRLGLDETELGFVLSEPELLSHLELQGVLSHLSSADEEDSGYTDKQLTLFNQWIELIIKQYNPQWIHIANSAGSQKFSTQAGNLFRIGISLYGQPPAKNLSNLVNLRESIQWKTVIAQLKWFEKDCPISYNRTYLTDKKSLIATLPVGYGDGYSRHLSNKAEVLVRGRRAKLVGRVCMDMVMIDVTSIEGVELMDEVVLIGSQEDNHISALEMADWAATINYEITCNISKRVPRIYNL